MTSILSDGVGSLRLAEIVILCSKSFGGLKIADEDYKQAVGMKFSFTSKFKTLKIVAINTKLIQTHIKVIFGCR